MTLFHEVSGQGPDLVLLHRWGLHGGYWKQLGGSLAQSHRVHIIDLPGHGRSGGIPCPETISELAGAVAGTVDRPAIWVGWSLGGMVALDLASRLPAMVRRQVLIAATPRFVQAPDWPHAMSESVFADFANGLARDYRATLRRFLSLQAGRDEAGRELIRQLREEMWMHGDPDPTAMRNGLTILERTDLRATVPLIEAPTLVIHGEQDRLVPPEAGTWLASRLTKARLERFSGAGHAPFLSQPQQVLAAIEEFLA